jgi:hypothetical protein
MTQAGTKVMTIAIAGTIFTMDRMFSFAQLISIDRYLSQFYILVKLYKADEVFLVEIFRLCSRDFCGWTSSFFSE